MRAGVVSSVASACIFTGRSDTSAVFSGSSTVILCNKTFGKCLKLVSGWEVVAHGCRETLVAVCAIKAHLGCRACGPGDGACFYVTGACGEVFQRRPAGVNLVVGLVSGSCRKSLEAVSVLHEIIRQGGKQREGTEGFVRVRCAGDWEALEVREVDVHGCSAEFHVCMREARWMCSVSVCCCVR